MTDVVPLAELKEARCVECGEFFWYHPLALGTCEVPCHYCPGCRARVLALDRDRGSEVERAADAEEAAAFVALVEQESHYGDWRVIDENGDELWARQLAKRYRKQTKPRGRWR